MRKAPWRFRDPVDAMDTAVINIAKLAVFLVVTASVIVSLYAAVNAAAVATDVNVFVSGLAVIVVGVVLGPLFCFFAAYGLVFDLDLPVWEAVMIVAPTLLAWSAVAGRFLLGFAGR